jgi:hypothetical protein
MALESKESDLTTCGYWLERERERELIAPSNAASEFVGGELERERVEEVFSFSYFFRLSSRV